MKKLIIILTVLFSFGGYSEIGYKLKDANYLSFSKDKIKVISQGYVYLLNNKLAMLPAKQLCGEDLVIPEKALISKKKASKRQKKLKCISKAPKLKVTR